ncbi:MAG: fibronectin type III domain-containing protein [Flavobacteriales bacterium]|nr:fibronectin type III domain-containing protein [Flavobacteriales bacterium]
MSRSFRFFGKGRQYALFLGFSMTIAATAQRNCGSMDYLQQQIDANPDRAARLEQIDAFTTQFILDHSEEDRAVITIPVVFHVVYANSTQNISDAKIYAQLAQLNADYARLNSDAGSTPSAFAALGANTEIQFCLAQRDPNGNATTGIVRKSTTVSSFSDNDYVKYNANGGSSAWPSSSYLNFWSCNLGSSLLGYAQFPGGPSATDGVVCLYSSIGSITTPGSATPYNLGRTATHEVGHWLNLRHIWGDANCGSDLVSDTPTQQTDNGGCPSFPHVTCSNGSNGDMFMNYMDYTNDACMNIFTLGQKSRMQALFGTGGSRVGLVSSLGCTPPSGGTCTVPSGLAAGSVTTSSAVISWGSMSGATSYSLQYKLASSGTWTTVSTGSTSYSLTGLSSGTSYNAQVSATCSSGSSGYSSAVNFTTGTTGCSDFGEPNNSTAAATSISAGSLNALIANSTDADYYRLTLTSTSNIALSMSNLAADYDLRLLNSAGTQLAISQAGGTTSESISYANAAAGTYYVHAFGYSGAFSATQCYALSATVTPVAAPCNTPTGLAASSITSSSASVSWGAVTGAVSYTVQFKLSSASTWTSGSVTGTTASLTGLTSGSVYNVQVQTVCASGTSAFSSTVSFTTSSAGCTDTWESNNTSSNAKTITRNTDIYGTIGTTTDIDWYKFTNTSSLKNIRIDLTNLAGDYDVVLYKGKTTQVGISQNGGTTSETIVYNGGTVTTYYVKVYGYNGANSATQCYTLRANCSGTSFREGVLDSEPIVLEPVTGLMNLYPNPANDKVMLEYEAKENSIVQLYLFDGTGRQVHASQQSVTNGNSTFGLPLPSLSNGIYVLQIIDGKERYQKRFLVEQ